MPATVIRKGPMDTIGSHRLCLESLRVRSDFWSAANLAIGCKQSAVNTWRTHAIVVAKQGRGVYPTPLCGTSEGSALRWHPELPVRVPSIGDTLSLRRHEKALATNDLWVVNCCSYSSMSNVSVASERRSAPAGGV